jgi:hypothetical protein
VLHLWSPHLQSILLSFFWRWVPVTIFMGWSWTLNLSILAYQLTRITGVSHQHLAACHVLEQIFW